MYISDSRFFEATFVLHDPAGDRTPRLRAVRHKKPRTDHEIQTKNAGCLSVFMERLGRILSDNIELPAEKFKIENTGLPFGAKSS